MSQFEIVKQVIEFLDAQQSRQPGLDEIAAAVGVSKFHLNRTFSQWAGVTPNAFLRSLTAKRAKDLLRQHQSVLDTALDVGLSGPSRLHDLCVSLEAASPGEIKTGGHGITIRLGFADSPFGHCLLGQTDRGLCHLSFVPSRDREQAEALLRLDWPQANLLWEPDEATDLAANIFCRTDAATNKSPQQMSLNLFVKGTSFQVRVWRALLELPSGHLATYGSLAAAIGSPQAARAVGSAVAKNEIGFVIPCHRVIRSTGVVGDYRWGTVRKRAIIAWETA